MGIARVIVVRLSSRHPHGMFWSLQERFCGFRFVRHRIRGRHAMCAVRSLQLNGPARAVTLDGTGSRGVRGVSVSMRWSVDGVVRMDLWLRLSFRYVQRICQR